MTWFVGTPTEGRSLWTAGAVYVHEDLPEDHPEREYIGEEYDVQAYSEGEARAAARRYFTETCDPGWIRIDVVWQM